MSEIKFEKKFHDWWYSKGTHLYDWKKPIFSRMLPFNRYHNNYFYKLVLSLSTNAKLILDYGCGDGSESFIFTTKDCKIIGFDISKSGIEKAQAKIRKNKIHNINFFVMDCENLGFEDNVFDIIFGKGIIHHLKISKAFKEIIRVLKPNGYAIFLEPLGINPIFNYLKKIIPSIKTENEHALTKNDFKLIRNFFMAYSFKFFHLFSVISSIFYKYKFFLKFFIKLNKIEEKLFSKLYPLGFLAWTSLIILKKPLKHNLKK